MIYHFIWFRCWLLLCFGLCIVLYMLLVSNLKCDKDTTVIDMVPKQKYVYGSEHRVISYDRYMPLIFVGGFPRSGTTLMRALLDAHPEIRCGQETRIIPRILGFRKSMLRSPKEQKRLKEAGITKEIFDSVLQNFILEIIVKHGTAAKYLCNKDPLTLESTLYLHHIFPNAKFLFMIRDGRAVVNSIISRKVKISGIIMKNPKSCLQRWNKSVQKMYSQCTNCGPSVCMPVYYEQLVLHPEIWMHKILQFLNIPWNESVLHHQDFVGKPGGITLSKTEKSTDQVIKPVNLQALSKWVGQFPEDVVREMAKIAPMLNVLGYDPNANPPNYGTPDSQVKENTLHIKANANFWQAREKDIFDKNPINQAKAKAKGRLKNRIDAIR